MIKKQKSEILISEKADSEAKQKNNFQGEFLERLDFLVTFLAMKKVTEKHLVQRDQKSASIPTYKCVRSGANRNAAAFPILL